MIKPHRAELRAKVFALQQAGISAADIAKQLSITSHTVRAWTNDEYAQRRRDQINARRRGERAPPKIRVLELGRVSNAEAAARLREIPPDTRDNTARLLGDPLPGRRAIDRLEP